jgi:hypothetical protein
MSGLLFAVRVVLLGVLLLLKMSLTVWLWCLNDTLDYCGFRK